MKSIPPLAPDCPLFRVRKYDSKVCFLCPSTLVRSRVSGLEEVLEVPIEDLWPSALWREIMCGVQEVAWLKEAERITKLPNFQPQAELEKKGKSWWAGKELKDLWLAHREAMDNALKWREWISTTR